MLLVLQVVAAFLFTDGTQVQVSRDSTRVDPVAITVSRGVRSLTQRLDRNTAVAWGYLALFASGLGDTPLRPDTLSAHARVFGFLHTTVACGSVGCRATLFEVAANYAYLRPGPLPLAQVGVLGRAIRVAGGWGASLGDPVWPYRWEQR